MTTIYINKKKYKLDPADLIQSGGEGMVFGLGNTAVKLYHQPTEAQANKLQHWFAQRKQFPPDVLAPCAAVNNKKGQIIGLQMARLPATTLPIKRLSIHNFWQQHALTTQQIIPLFVRLHQTLSQLHRSKIIVGDLNETNIYINLSGNNPIHPFWIDVDSYQFAHFPCPVAMPAFLDPSLYHVTNFAKRPYFTPLTDWYAFNVLLFKSLLQVHPYGGVHRQHKSLQARATAQVSLLDSNVKLPPRARPVKTLSDGLLQQLHSTFDKGERRPFPIQLLHQYAHSLQTCTHCQQAYPANRRGCPTCSQPTPTPIQPKLKAGIRTLLQVDGLIEDVFVQPNGRLLIIYRQGKRVHLVRAGVGGVISQTELFNGEVGYRFAAFTRPDGHSFLAVNPPHRPQLLLLDIHKAQPQQVTLLETAMYRETAVFAATPTHLYRISGGWIMRGSVQKNGYLEDAIGTAHRAQTQLFGAPLSNTVAGFHRVLSAHHFFAILPNGTEKQLQVPAQAHHEHITEAAIRFAPKHIGVMRQLSKNGRLHTDAQQFNLAGSWQQGWNMGHDGWETAVNHFPFIDNQAAQFPHPLAESDQLHPHPAGWLIQQSHMLKFLPTRDAI